MTCISRISPMNGPTTAMQEVRLDLDKEEKHETYIQLVHAVDVATSRYIQAKLFLDYEALALAEWKRLNPFVK